MIKKLDLNQRIDQAKIKIEKVLDHFLYVIELHENNKIIAYSSTLSGQIPESCAANAFNVFQRAMHHFEIVRLCALWDSVDVEKENIPTVVELIDDAEIIELLSNETESYWKNHPISISNPSPDPEIAKLELESFKQAEAEFGARQGDKARQGLQKAIETSKEVINSGRLISLMNMRDKHLAHSLTTTRREQTNIPIEPVKYGDEALILEQSIPIIEDLMCWIKGTSFSIEESRKIDRRYAEALWHGCTFKVLE